MTLLFTLECQYATIAGSIAKVLFYKLPYHRSTKFNVLTAVLTTNIFLLRFKYKKESTVCAYK